MNTINDTRWQEWADSVLKNGQKEPMDRPTQDIMTGIFMSATEDRALGNFVTAANVQDEKLPWIMRVTLVHAARIGLKAHRGVIAMAAVLSKGSPGMAIVYVHLFRRMQQRNDDRILSSSDAVRSEFAMGFLSAGALEVAWSSQKEGGANYLDSIVDPSVEVPA